MGLQHAPTGGATASFRLPFAFIATGIIGFIVYHLVSLASFSGWIHLYPRGPQGWTHVHLLILGWAVMIAMGAVYQLTHVVLQRNIFSEKLGFVHFFFFFIGTCGLLWGFHSARMDWIAISATLAFIGILCFVVNISITLALAKLWNAVTISTACAVGYLLLGSLAGMTMGINFMWNGLGEIHEHLFRTHIWVAAAGWFGMLITGFSYKLLPMFYLSHAYPTKLQYVILSLWNAGVLLGAISFLFDLPLILNWLAWAFITAALIVYCVHIKQIQKRKFKKNPGSGVQLAVRAAQGLTVFAILMLIVFLFLPKYVFHPTMVVMVGWAYLWGWVALTILGYLSKIAPFLWWTKKYGAVVGKVETPTLAQMISDRLVRLSFYAFFALIVVLLAGILTHTNLIIEVFGSLMSLVALFYITLIIRVFTK